MTRQKLLILVPLLLVAALIIVLVTAPNAFDSKGALRAATSAADQESELALGEELGGSTDLVDVAPGDEAREAIAAPAAPVALPEGPARISVVLRGGGEPFPGCIVRFDAGSGAALDVPGTGGRIGVTGQDGRATFRVPPHSTLAAEVVPFGTDAVERWSIAAPGPGETRDFLISLPPRSVKTSQFEVVDRDSGRPVEGARLRIVDGGVVGTVFTATTGPSGVLMVPVMKSARLTLTAAGYVERTATLQGDEVPSGGLLPLVQFASVRGRIPAELVTKEVIITLTGLRVSDEFVFDDKTLRLTDLPPKGWTKVRGPNSSSRYFRKRSSAKGNSKSGLTFPSKPWGTPESHDCIVSPDGRWEITGIEIPMGVQALEGGRLVFHGAEYSVFLDKDLALKPGDHKDMPFPADWEVPSADPGAADR